MSNFKQSPFFFAAKIDIQSPEPGKTSLCHTSTQNARTRFYFRERYGIYWNIFTAPQNVNFHAHIDEPQIGHDTPLPETVICGMIGFKVASSPEHIRQAVKTGFDTAVDNYVSLPF